MLLSFKSSLYVVITKPFYYLFTLNMFRIFIKLYNNLKLKKIILSVSIDYFDTLLYSECSCSRMEKYYIRRLCLNLAQVRIESISTIRGRCFQSLQLGQPGRGATYDTTINVLIQVNIGMALSLPSAGGISSHINEIFLFPNDSL